MSNRESPLSSESHGTRAILAAFAANFGIAIAKLVGFFITASGSMLAEAIHSFADTANQALLLLGGRQARRAPDEDHPFGYSRERYFWAFVVAVVLFTMGAVFAVVQGVEKIRHPHQIDDVAVAVVILGLAIIFEAASLRTALVAARRMVEPGTPLWQFIRRSKAPEVPVVLLEDFAALCGLFIAMAAIITAKVTGNGTWDGVGTVLIGILLGVVAIVLSIEMKSLLIGESASPERRREIEDALLIDDHVHSVIHLRTQHLGPDDLLIAAKVEFDHSLSYTELARAIDRTETEVRKVAPDARLLFIEPDVRRSDTADEVSDAATEADPADQNDS